VSAASAALAAAEKRMWCVLLFDGEALCLAAASWQVEISGLVVPFNAEQCINACRGFVVVAVCWSRMLDCDGQSSVSQVPYPADSYLQDGARC
jgi:hypothetical protein